MARGIGRLAQHCNCFVAGTLVLTAAGALPIESVAIGDQVLTLSQDDPHGEPCYGTVMQVFESPAPATLWVTFEDGRTLGLTPGHEVWTFEAGWTAAGRVQVGDAFKTESGERLVVAQLFLDPHPTTVYNFEVDGTFTYYAEGVWVHNASCGRVANAYGHSFELAIMDIYNLRKYNGPMLRGNGTTFVPDFLDGGLIGDIKGADYVYRTPQLEAMVDYANTNGLQPVLFVAGDVSAWVAQNFQVIMVP